VSLGANTYFRYYRTSDGMIAVGSTSPTINARIRQVLDLEDPRTEPDFDVTDAGDRERLHQFAQTCEARLAERTSAE
jgi:hypothetical protein